MPPVPDVVSILLRSSPTAAMAALLLISTSHRGLLDWFARTVCGDAPAEVEPQPRRRKTNGVDKRFPSAGKTTNGPRRITKREADDDALIAALKSNPEGTIGDWSTTVGKSRTSIVTALHRLRAAGLAETREGRWRLVEEPAPREPPAKWIEPLSASQRAHVHA